MKVMKFLKGLDLKNKTDEEKIAAIENKIKTEIKIERNGGEEYSYIGFILKNKLTNYRGLYSLYLKCFILSKLDLTLVMACDRFSGEIDVDFPSGMDLDFPIFYFDKLNKYITPNNLPSRLGYTAPEFGGSKGLYIRLSPQIYAKYYYAYEGYRIKTLPTMDMEMTKNTNLAMITIEDDVAKIDYERTSSGYRAISERMFMQEYLIKDDNISGLIRGLDDLEVDSYEFKNGDINMNMDPKVPFIIQAQLQSKTLIESIGNDLLVKVGMIIGTQNKLSKERNRENDVVLRYKQHYDHHIKVKIPEGYSCSNLEEFKKDITVLDEDLDMETMFFHLDYTLIDNVLDISVKEGYNTLEVKKENYESYRNIVNSAADFNALTLVLEKL